MLTEVRAQNCFSFEKDIVFSLKADMRNKKFAANVHNEGNFNILKTVGVYGPNNAGKTCLIRCIRAFKQIVLHEQVQLSSNFYSDSPLCRLGVTFVTGGKEYNYDVSFDTDENEYPYEKFSEIKKDQYGNEKEEIWFLKDSIAGDYVFEDKQLSDMIPMMSQNNILIYLVDASKFPKLAEIKKILTSFAEKIDIVDMNNIPFQKTLQLMKNENGLQQKVVDFIKNADLYMDDFKYVPIEKMGITVKAEPESPEEKVLNLSANKVDQLGLVSVYKGHSVPSMLFDSTGTKKIAALASYIIEALEEGRVLVVDELDSSIHFRLTRAIVAMFNNELNKDAQMIFTVHDINLMDCKRLFRKEQIWFVHKDEEGVYLYSLADFTARDGVRDTTDIMEKYRRGALGALPDPELINSLLEIRGNDGREEREGDE